MKIRHFVGLTLMPLAAIPSLAQVSAQQPNDQLPSQAVRYQICNFAVDPQTGEAISVCSPVNKCTITGEKISKLSTHRQSEEIASNQSNPATAHAIHAAM